MKRALYFHGFASSPSSSKALFFRKRLAAAAWDVVIPALDGGDFEGLTLSRQLAIAEHAADGEPMPLIGSSMGGYLAALYVARHPDTPKVALLAPAFDFANRWRMKMGDAALAEWQRNGVVETFHYGSGKTERLGYSLYQDALQYESYPDVKQPCLIFHGKQDDVVPVELSRKFAVGRANVRLEELDAGHDLLNALELMGDAVAAFLNEA